MELESVKAKLASLLRDKPLGTTADITEHTVVCWNGEKLVGVHLCADHPGFDDMFEIDHDFCGDMHEHLEEWLADPRFSHRPDLLEWLAQSSLPDRFRPDA
jgi:diadenosine tetraphosphatase ApaH/serine/threonine PP2A family protein phosphatase